MECLPYLTSKHSAYGLALCLFRSAALFLVALHYQGRIGAAETEAVRHDGI